MLDLFDAATERLSTDFARRLQRHPDDLEVRQTAAVAVATLQEVFFQWAANTDDFDIGAAAIVLAVLERRRCRRAESRPGCSGAGDTGLELR